MNRETFERVLVEEGFDDASLRSELWHSRPPEDLDEAKLRKTAKELKKQLPELLMRQALNRAMDKEFGRL